jgi:hypothetical protein
MQSFERAGHRSGTAPTHQRAPPTTRVASRLIGCPPGFAHGRPRWPRSRVGRPTGPPPLRHPRAHEVTEMAKLGRMHTIGRRGLPGARNPCVGTAGRRLRHPWSSCRSGRAPRSWRCRTAHRRRRAARRDRRSGRSHDGRRAGSQGTSPRARHARRGARGRSDVARPACCTGRCAGCGWTGGRGRCSGCPRGW